MDNNEENSKVEESEKKKVFNDVHSVIDEDEQQEEVVDYSGSHIAKKRSYYKKQSPMWKFGTVILSVLLLFQIYSASQVPSVDDILSDVNKLGLQYNNEDALSTITGISEDLNSLKGKTNSNPTDKITGKITEPITGTQTDFSGDSVKLDFYVMSQCPYGVQVEDAIAPVLKELGNAIDFNVDFIANDNGDGTFDSLHGQPEVEGNIVQLCAVKYEPDNYMDLISCMNKNAQAIPGNWEKCSNDLEMNTDAIKTCYESDEGKQLHSVSIAKAQAVQARGSPTIFLNDQPYSGGRDPLAFKMAVCSKLDNHPACAELPACGSSADCTPQDGKIATCENPGLGNAECVYSDAVEFEVIILTDDECASCDTTQIQAVNANYFPGAKHRVVDAKSEEGKELIAKYEVTYAPTFIFDTKLKETNAWTTYPQIQGSFIEASDKLKLDDRATGAKFFVDAEARKSFEDAFGLTKDDNKPQIDFFVMSYCPYGNQAEEGIEPVFQLLKDSAEFKPHYVIYSNYAGGGPTYCLDENDVYCSMHGIVELNQNVREMCVEKYYNVEKWFEFAIAMNTECNSQNADTCWESVASGMDIDTAKIAKCQAEEALDLLAPEKALNDMLGISGSPTVYVEGQAYNGGRAPENYKLALCQAFSDAPEECANVLGTTEDAAAGSC